MFIEDETEAVFNEIRNLKKDNNESEEEMTVSPGRARAPMITMNVDVVSREEVEVEVEEPVSPPACHPSEGPPLLFSQSIEVRDNSQ